MSKEALQFLGRAPSFGLAENSFSQATEALRQRGRGWVGGCSSALCGSRTDVPVEALAATWTDRQADLLPEADQEPV